MQSTHDLIVLGAGSGGLATAFRAARLGARVALLEPAALGGTCVNVGCVPKKAMWYAAQMAEAQQLARDYGFAVRPGPLDWPTFVARRQRYIDGIHASYRKRIKAAGIELIPAHGRIEATQTVAVDGRRLRAPHIVIATGARPRKLDVPGFEHGIDSDGFFELRACPARVAVVGSGYVGAELSGVLQALGAKVDIIGQSALLSGFDSDMTDALAKLMHAQGIRVHCGCEVRGVRRVRGALQLQGQAGADENVYDQILWAVGRVPNSEHLGLETAGIECDDAGHVSVDAFQNTNVAGVYAIGDVTARKALTPVAIAAGRQLAERLFGGHADAHVDYTNIPTVAFAHPPLASVGLAECTAREEFGEGVRCYRNRFTPMQLALTDTPRQALVKMVCVGDDERVAGVHVLGPGADEMIQGFAVAVKMGARKADFDATVAVHPTAAEELVLLS